MEFLESDLPEPPVQDLPTAGYDHLPELGLEGRIKGLGREHLEVLLRHGREHRNRTPVTRLLTARLREPREGGQHSHPCGGYGRPTPAGRSSTLPT